MSDIYFLRKLWLTPNFGHALIPTLRLSLPFFLEKESESIKESNTFLQKVKVNASATLWFAEKESNFFGLRRDRTKKLQTAHIMDVSLTQFGRMLKSGWKEGLMSWKPSFTILMHFWLCFLFPVHFWGNKLLLCSLWSPSTYNWNCCSF